MQISPHPSTSCISEVFEFRISSSARGRSDGARRFMRNKIVLSWSMTSGLEMFGACKVLIIDNLVL